MPGSTTTPDSGIACNSAILDVAFHTMDSVGVRNKNDFAAQWLACTYPCQRWRRESKHSDKWKLCDTNPGLRPEKAG